MHSLQSSSTIVVTNRPAALASGIGILIMAVAAGLAFGFLQPQIMNEGATRLMGIKIALWWLVVALDFLVSVTLYLVFRKSGPALALGAMVSRLLYTLLLVVAVRQLYSGSGSAQLIQGLEGFNRIWSPGLIIFGVHLAILGALLSKTRGFYRGLGLLLLGAGFSYMLIHGLNHLGSRAASITSLLEPWLAVPMAGSELILAIWLLIAALSSRRIKQGAF